MDPKADLDARMIGQSLLPLRARLRRLAATKPTILVTGPTGVGKELVALELRRHADLMEAPFVAVNCATLSDPLVESELFGYVKGAHSTATADKAGLFEEASGGILFLDEIVEFTMAVQAKLLRAIEAKTIRRIGESRERHVDVWIVAATNQKLGPLVKMERFREDLYWRLMANEVEVPALRERRGDIPELLDFHLGRLSHPGLPTTLASSAINLLSSYPWPGNVRELVGMASNWVTEYPGREVSLEAVKRMLAKRGWPPKDRESFDHYYYAKMHTALHEADGNVRRAAEKLGISPRHFYRQMRENSVPLGTGRTRSGIQKAPAIPV